MQACTTNRVLRNRVSAQTLFHILLTTALLLCASTARADRYKPDFGDKTRVWIGPEWWANPLQDWSLREGRVTAYAVHNRTLCLTTHSITTQPGSDGLLFTLSAKVAAIVAHRKRGTLSRAGISVGFRIGRRGPNPSYLSGVFDAREYITASLSTDGILRLGDQTTRVAEMSWGQDRKLKLSAFRETGDRVRLVFTSNENEDDETSISTTTTTRSVLGGVALLSHGPEGQQRSAKARFQFRDIILKGEGVTTRPLRTIGPIVWTQYLISERVLKVQAQLMPVEEGPNSRPTREEGILRTARVVSASDNDKVGKPKALQWVRRARSRVDPLSRTITFTVGNWDVLHAHKYSVRFRWEGEVYESFGEIRAEPRRGMVKVGVFSCDFGYLFPHTELIRKVLAHNPDLLYFAGDQIYETNDEFGNAKFGPLPIAMLDYLRRWIRFGLSWAPVLRTRPAVVLPDDHDVFHGDLFGQGGVPLPIERLQGRGGGLNYQRGGYLMMGEWVRAVERTQTGTLPAPATPDITLPIGINTHFTSVRYGRVSFAVIEDRKFKTGPDTIPAGALRNQGLNASLFGKRQEEFLSSWASDWTGHELKVALTQTMLCKVTTHSGYQLRRSRYIYDSGAWPPAARNRAVSILARARALSLHGDQHLGAVVRMAPDGVSDKREGSRLYSFMVPGTANGWPRAWWPNGSKGRATGAFRDDARHEITVLGVGNPDRGSNILANLLGDRISPSELAFRKGSGYGMVGLDTVKRTATIELFRIGRSTDISFKGFPITIDLGGDRQSECERRI